MNLANPTSWLKAPVVQISNKGTLVPEVKVNSISPGWINTDKKYIPTKEDNLQHPSGRVGTPEDIVDAVKFLLKNRGFITGSDFVIDGGMTKKMIYV